MLASLELLLGLLENLTTAFLIVELFIILLWELGFVTGILFYFCGCPILGLFPLAGEGGGVFISVGYGDGDVLVFKCRMASKKLENSRDRFLGSDGDDFLLAAN